MSLFDRIAFNIFANTTLSFIGGLLIVFLSIRIFRLKGPGFKLYLYSVPFIKIIFDIIRGIPPDSYVWSQLNFYSLPEKMLGQLSAQLGLSEFGPMLALNMGIISKDEPNVVLYSVSLADGVYTWILQHMGETSVSLMIVSALTISSALVIKRLATWIRFEIDRKWDRDNRGILLEKLTVGKRMVDVYLTPSYEGSPFTGGILKPYICFPTSTYAKLEECERRSVVAHELIHIRNFDILQTFFISVLGDLFWFIPFYKSLSHKIDELRELVADRESALSEEEALSLANALLKLKKNTKTPPDPALYAAVAKRPSLISQRVHRLLDPNLQKVTTTKLRKTGFILLAVVVTSLVMNSTFVGNYQLTQTSDFSDYLDVILQRFLKS